MSHMLLLLHDESKRAQRVLFSSQTYSIKPSQGVWVLPTLKRPGRKILRNTFPALICLLVFKLLSATKYDNRLLCVDVLGNCWHTYYSNYCNQSLTYCVMCHNIIQQENGARMGRVVKQLHYQYSDPGSIQSAASTASIFGSILRALSSCLTQWIRALAYKNQDSIVFHWCKHKTPASFRHFQCAHTCTQSWFLSLLFT
jgi:hypothetical protein